MIPKGIVIGNRRLPDTPGVYLMKNAAGAILYIGQAGNLKRRVTSYFTRPQDERLERFVREIRRIDYRRTDTALEALILEAQLIKKFSPPWNVREKDDKSFLYVELTDEKFPRVLLARGRDEPHGARFGPFTAAASIREALRILRRIFPWSTHTPEQIERSSKPCFEYELGLCPGTCANRITKQEYLKNIRNIRLILEGKKKKTIAALTQEMRSASRRLEFEKAGTLRRQLFALQHIQDVALLTDSQPTPPRAKKGLPAAHFRIEGFDISNIFGASAVGSMVVFTDGEPDKREYRKFRIKTVHGAHDIAMLKEVFRRRFGHRPRTGGWPLPQLILVDGGAGQVNAAHTTLRAYQLRIPVVGIAKGSDRKKNEVFGKIPRGVELRTLVRVRDEAHRFAVRYHKTVRGRMFIDSRSMIQ
ncbi:MAG: hypothetical protein A3A43_00990 [Candidatus Liptonbacteria bacterium RIFCSPLOWO2_01_FULL_56_20]|uniref:Excinuclease ABC subunit C n=1 Tax=Candidatus Liptonbacteria bacterium RIFCSPLOWO2_01_FULL_56_20 TaxID=1798652 RepID=A0A1G2CK02_9BACT|nr:MAG: hypothetical protein A3A43_00990 [Candidatus Liptonbacteria bacterium RIFCSPLOWO2_01_FULL_56_20]